MRGFQISSLLFFILSLSHFCFSQDNHYWHVQPDGHSSMLGASVTANTDDNTAIYYNPGALGNITETRLGFNANVYFLDVYFIENGAGDGINLSANVLDALPLLLSGSIQFKKAQNFTLSYLYMSKNKSRVRLEANTNYTLDFFEDGIISEQYFASYTLDRDLREEWIGVGFGFGLSKHISIGFSPIVTIYNNNYLEITDISLFSGIGNGSSLLISQYDLKESRISAVGVLLNTGVVLKLERNEIGVTLTTPRLSLSSLSRSSSNRNLSVFNTIPGEETNEKIIANYSGARSTYKSPLVVNLGYARTILRNKFSIRLAYYSNIDPYNLLDTENTGTVIGTSEEIDRVSPAPQYSNRQILNVGLGMERQLNDKLRLLLGYRSDFRFVDDQRFGQNDFVPVVSRWNLHHFSGGGYWENRWFRLNLGLEYAFARERNMRQYVNLNNPSKRTGLEAATENIANVSYDHFRIYLGLTLKFVQPVEPKN